MLLEVIVSPADLQRKAGIFPELMSVPAETIAATLRLQGTVAAAHRFQTEDTGRLALRRPTSRPYSIVAMPARVPSLAQLYPRSTSCDGHGARSVSQDALQQRARHLPPPVPSHRRSRRLICSPSCRSQMHLVELWCEEYPSWLGHA